MSRTETTSIPARSPSVSNLTSPNDATIKPSVSETVTSSTPAPVTDKPASTPEQTVKQTEKVVDAVDSSEVPKASPLDAIIDMEQFNQILELDGDGDYDFSASMVGAFFDQASSTFDEMKDALEEKNLTRLSELGHFLKGSSAQLGVSLVQSSCEKIQHYGLLKDQENNVDLTDVEALKKINDLMGTVRAEYDSAEAWLKNYFEEKGVDITAEAD